jgi:predicted Zn-dependent peptidase
MNNKINMKTKLYSLFLAILFSLGINAQVDRSKQPEPGPAPKISIDKPYEFKLKNGLKVLVVENHKLPRVSYSLRIDNKPTPEGDISGVSSILSAMLGNGTTSISKDAFNEEVDFLGASISFGSSSAFASSLSKYSDRILELMADATINPLLKKEEFQKEKDKLIESLKTEEKTVSAAASRVSNALSYGINHPNGEFITEESVNNITFSNVLVYYETHFNPKDAYLVVVGDVDKNDLKDSVEKYFGSWKNSASIEADISKPMPNAQYTQINFVDMPNAVQSNIILTNNVDLKMQDEDYYAALVANFILGGGGTGYLFQNLREDKAYTYGSYSSIGASRYGASRFSATAEVRNEVTDSSVVEILKEVERIRTENVKPEILETAKASYLGNFVMALESPQTVANFAMNIKLNNLPSDYYENYLKKINEVSADDVKRAANKYFQSDKARIIVVGKGSEVLDNLEKTGIPIMYFDKYANKIDKPVFSKPLPEGVTAETVIKNYISAVGGEENLKKVSTILMNANVTIPGAPYKPTAIMKQMAPNKSSMELSIEGMGTVMKQNFDGENGYQEGQGQKMPMDEKTVNSKKSEKGLYPELYLEPSTMELESIATIDGTDVYKIKVTKGEAKEARYYDVKSGLLLRTEETADAGGVSVTTTTDFSDYKDVDGVMMPYVMKIKTGPQAFEFSMTDIKVNEGVTEEDFK